jgi:SAM-dependent methyltransferase
VKSLAASDTEARVGGGGAVDKGWVDCDRATVKRRYDRLAKFIPLFDRLLFLPPGLRRRAVEHFAVARRRARAGNRLRGRVYGVDLSPGMLQRARTRCAGKRRRNVALYECDAGDFVAPEPLGGVLFCLSYNTMPHHRAVLRRAWKALRPGGRLVIMDARLPSGRSAKWLLPFSLWLMKYTMLGNPLIQPWA